jgi:hypothetical protein
MPRDQRLSRIAQDVEEGQDISNDDAAYLLDVIYLQQEQLFSEIEDINGKDDEDGFDEFGECTRCNGLGCAACGS